MSFFNRNVHHLFTLRYKKIDYFIKNPELQQEQVLLDLVNSAKKTEWGKNHGFKNVSRYDDFIKSSTKMITIQ
jgi:hypothetical protein